MFPWISRRAPMAALVLLAAAGSAAYVVQPGDTLGAIADRVGVSTSDLVARNDLHAPDLIYPGQVLVTGSEEDATPSSSETTHIVKAGETLSGVAAAHGVDPDMLARANGIVNGRLTAGVRLQLTPLRVPFDPSAGGAHVIAAGESVASIAKAHGTTVEDLMNLNHIHAGESLEAGQRMRISSGWLCPVPGAQFANDWGWVKGDGRTHEGVDVFANRGAAIVAPVAGHLHQDEGPSGGLQFTLWGDDGVIYFGSHMDSFGASGDVSAGETIGTIGSTGNAAGTSPHLHFEVHTTPTDRTANPYPALVAACK